MIGVNVPEQIYAHIAGIDMVRADGGEYFVLEDNLRTPSGVFLHAGKPQNDDAALPGSFAHHAIALVEHYPDLLLNNLRSVATKGVDNPTVVVLTPGQYNSAYFEHAFLAQQMGIELVDGNDLFVRGDTVYM